MSSTVASAVPLFSPAISYTNLLRNTDRWNETTQPSTVHLMHPFVLSRTQYVVFKDCIPVHQTDLEQLGARDAVSASRLDGPTLDSDFGTKSLRWTLHLPSTESLLVSKMVTNRHRLLSM